MVVLTLWTMHMFMFMFMLIFIQTMANELMNDCIQLIVLFAPHHHNADLCSQMGEQRIGAVSKAVYGLRFSYLVKAIKEARDKLAKKDKGGKKGKGSKKDNSDEREGGR
jgi:hypothetical protein